MRKRTVALLLAVVMIVSLLPTAAFAADDGISQIPPAVTEEEKGELFGAETPEAPDPAESPEATEAPDPAETPEATEEPDPAESPEATEEPDPVETPEATEEPDPAESPEVTEVPDPVETPEATEVPDPVESPEATEVPDLAKPMTSEVVAEEGIMPLAGPAVGQPVPADSRNIALGKTVYVSAGEDYKNLAVDGSGKVGGGGQWIAVMKQSSGDDVAQTEVWLVVDLGEGIENLDIEEIKIWYNGNNWAQKYRIETSDAFDSSAPDSAQWTQLVAVERNPKGEGYVTDEGTGNNIANSTYDYDTISLTSTPAIADGVKVQRYVRLYIEKMNSLCPYTDVGIVEFQIMRKPFTLPAATAEEIQNTPLSNLFRPRPQDQTPGAKVSVTATDQDSNVAANTIDGLPGTRWSSLQHFTPKELIVDMGETQAVGYIKLLWMYLSITEFDIDISLDGTNWATVFHYGEKDNESFRIRTKEQTCEFTPVVGRYVRLNVTGHDGRGDKPGAGSNSYPSVELCEIEAYRNKKAVPLNPEAVAEKVEFFIQNDQVVMDTAKAQAFAAEEGWEFTFDSYGCGIEQIVGEDGAIHRPLVNTRVEMDAVVTRTFDGAQGNNAKNPFVLTVPGAHTANMGNAKPKVIPEIMEWFSSSDQKGKNYTLTSGSKIVAPAALRHVADEVQADIKDLFGLTLTVAETGGEAGDIVLALDAAKAGEGFDEETYLMEVTDKVVITGIDAQGVYWGTRTALQALKLSGGKKTIPQGTARDYPEFRVRGFVLDVGRKPVTMDMLYSIMKNMSWYKLNDFHVHLNDNLIAIENYGYNKNEWASEEEKNEKYAEGNRAYAAFRLESSLQHEAGGNPLAARDYHYTKAEFKQFMEDSAKLGVNIVPEIDVPAHAKAITDAFPSIREPANFKRHALNDHFNLSGKFDESLAKTKEIFNDYIGTTFVGDIVHFGADEYYPSPDMYRKFHKAMIDFLKNEKGVTVRTWGSLSEMSSDDPQYQYSKAETAGVQMDIWNTGWANPSAMYELGFDLINVTDGPSYMVPKGNGGRGGYGDYLDLNSIYGWAPNCIGGTWFPAGSSQILGSAYAMWGDSLLDMAASGLDEIDLFDRFYDALPVIAVRQWGEGDKLDRTLGELQTDAAVTGLAPQTNPYRVVRPGTDGKVFSYTFDTDGTDSSGNNRNLTLTNAEVTGDGALSIKGGGSYAKTGLDFIGWGGTLTFTVNVTKAPAAAYGEVIFESDRVAEDSTFPYNEYAIKALPVEGDPAKWKLGFTRELYDYEFNREFTVGTPVTLTLVTAQQERKDRPNGQRNTTDTKLIVNGNESDVVELTGKMQAKPDSNTQFMGRTDVPYSSLELPVARIGSKTNAFTGTLDNISATSPEVAEPEQPEEGIKLVDIALKQPVTASSGGASAAKAVDGDVSLGGSLNWWASAPMKDSAAPTTQTAQWLEVDLGLEEGVSVPIEEIALNYRKQRWPQKYRVETTDDAPDAENRNWTTLVSVQRSLAHGWIGNNHGPNAIEQESSRPVGSGVSIGNSDWIKGDTVPGLAEGAAVKRYVRLYVEEINPQATDQDGGGDTPNTGVAVIEFMIWARVPETESAENIKAYRIADKEVRLSWDEGGYYQVYAKAPGGQWECVSGNEVVDGSVFLHNGYTDGMIYRVLAPTSDVNEAFGIVTPIDARIYDSTAGHVGWVDVGNSDRVTLGTGWDTYGAEHSWYQGSVHLQNNVNENTTLEFVFVGNGVQVIGDLFGNSLTAASMSVFIDGVDTGEVMRPQGTGSDNVHDQILYSKTGLDNGFHTLKLVPKTTGSNIRIAIDALRVLVPTESIALSAAGLTEGKLTIATGGSAVNVTATVSPVNGSGEFAWTSSDETTATVATTEPDPDLEGKMVATITPVAGGRTTVAITDQNAPTVKAEIAVTVNQSVTNVTLPDNQHSVTLYLNAAGSQTGVAVLTPTVMPANATNKAVTWSSSDESIAKVEQGTVTAVGRGEATITVTTVDGNKTTTCVVTVKSNPTAIAVKDSETPVTEAAPAVIYNNKDTTGLPNTVRGSVTLTAVPTPADASETDMTWERTDASTGLITIEPVENDSTQCLISAVGMNERDVGEKVIEVASVSNPAVKTRFKVQVRRYLVHDVTLSVHAGAEPKPGAVLEVNINQLNLNEAGENALSYQWYRGSEAITGATEKTYTLADEDIGKVISAKVTATATDTCFYEGQRTTTNPVTVDKNAAPAAPSLTATAATSGDGTITIAGYTAGTLYEISADNGARWTDATVTDGVISGLAAGDYQVRLKATDTHDAGLPATITVKDSAKTYFDVSYTATPAEGGVVTLDKTSAEANAPATATVKANPGYTIKSVTVGGVEVTAAEGQDGAKAYTITAVTANVEFEVTFEAVKLTITHDLSNGLSCSQAAGSADAHSHEVSYGAQEAITLVAAEGYSLPDRQSVTVKKTAGGEAFLGYEYSPETGVITITGGVTEDLTITAAGVVTTYQISHALTHVQCGLEEHIVAHKAALTIALRADEGYVLPDAITVTMAGTALAAGTDYTYTRAEDKATGEVKLAAGKITGALEVRIDAERIMIPLVSVSIEGTAKVGQRLVARVNPAEAANYVNYQWIRVDEDGSEATAEDIAGATGMSRVITEDSLGKKIKVKVVPSEGSQYTGTVVSLPTALVIAADAPSIPVELVSLDKTSATVILGSTLRLAVTIRPSNATDQTVTWSSDNEAVATVDSAGVVTGLTVGTAVITVTTADGGKTAQCQVTVREQGEEAEVFQVVFDAQGGSAVAAQTVEKGGKAIKPADPGRSGYTFTGWYTDAGCTAAYDFDTAVTGNLTLYAGWRRNSSSGGGSSNRTETTKTETTKNPDGSTTTTVTDKKTGTVTETTKWPNGKVEKVETKKDGAVTTTTTEPSGKKVEKAVTAQKDVTITVTAPEGEVIANVKLPAQIPEPEVRFEDVPADHWADKAIHAVAGLGLVEGVGENRYDMTTPMTRGSLATVLYRLSNGKPSTEINFADVEKDEWYTQGIAWAARNGVVTGVSADVFKPKDVITREQLAVMLCRYAQVLGMETGGSAKALESFRDGAETGDWAVDGVAWCVEKGILQGKGDNVLDPKADVSRAEVAVMLERFIALMR